MYIYIYIYIFFFVVNFVIHWNETAMADSFIDSDGYSISSEGFLPTVVDILVIWFEFTHSNPFLFTDS